MNSATLPYRLSTDLHPWESVQAFSNKIRVSGRWWMAALGRCTFYGDESGSHRDGPPRGSPKTGHRGSLQNRPTITIIQDVDFDTGAATLGRCEQCLERRTKTASYSIGTVGLVAAEDSEDHRRPTRDGRRLSARGGHRCTSAGCLGTECAGKTGQRSDPRPPGGKTGQWSRSDPRLGHWIGVPAGAPAERIRQP